MRQEKSAMIWWLRVVNQCGIYQVNKWPHHLCWRWRLQSLESLLSWCEQKPAWAYLQMRESIYGTVILFFAQDWSECKTPNTWSAECRVQKMVCGTLDGVWMARSFKRTPYKNFGIVFQVWTGLRFLSTRCFIEVRSCVSSIYLSTRRRRWQALCVVEKLRLRNQSIAKRQNVRVLHLLMFFFVGWQN